MRKVILLNMITLDGYFDGPGEGFEKIDWHHADEEWEDYSVELLSGADTLLFGRKTYEGFAAFWPAQEGRVRRCSKGTRVAASCACSIRASFAPALSNYAMRQIRS